MFRRVKYFLKDIKTKTKHYYQKFRYGVSDYECWNLDFTIAKAILPKLKRFRSMKRWGCPAAFTADGEMIRNPNDPGGEPFLYLTEEEWNQILDEIIFAFDYTINEDHYNKLPAKPGESNKYIDKSQKLFERQKRGLKLFTLYYGNLWD